MFLNVDRHWFVGFSYRSRFINCMMPMILTTQIASTQYWSIWINSFCSSFVLDFLLHLQYYMLLSSRKIADVLFSTFIRNSSHPILSQFGILYILSWSCLKVKLCNKALVLRHFSLQNRLICYFQGEACYSIVPFQCFDNVMD